MLELVDQLLRLTQSDGVRVRPKKKPHESVFFLPAETGPRAHRSFTLAPRERRKKARLSATETALTVDDESVAQVAASGANQREMASPPATLQPEAYTGGRRKSAISAQHDDVNMSSAHPVGSERTANVR
jgi:hypothetical protein